MERYDIWQNGAKIKSAMLARGAAAELRIDETDLEWAIHEHGRCDSAEDKTAVPMGSPEPSSYDDWCHDHAADR